MGPGTLTAPGRRRVQRTRVRRDVASRERRGRERHGFVLGRAHTPWFHGVGACDRGCGGRGVRERGGRPARSTRGPSSKASSSPGAGCSSGGRAISRVSAGAQGRGGDAGRRACNGPRCGHAAAHRRGKLRANSGEIAARRAPTWHGLGSGRAAGRAGAKRRRGSDYVSVPHQVYGNHRVAVLRKESPRLRFRVLDPWTGFFRKAPLAWDQPPFKYPSSHNVYSDLPSPARPFANPSPTLFTHSDSSHPHPVVSRVSCAAQVRHHKYSPFRVSPLTRAPMRTQDEKREQHNHGRRPLALADRSCSRRHGAAPPSVSCRRRRPALVPTRADVGLQTAPRTGNCPPL